MFPQLSKVKKKRSKDDGSLEQEINLSCDSSSKSSEVQMTSPYVFYQWSSNSRFDVRLRHGFFDSKLFTRPCFYILAESRVAL